MLEQIKALALQKLQEKMSGNSLNAEATNEAAQEGVGALLENIKGGDLSQITALFGGSSDTGAASGLMENLQGKLGEILQKKGMSSDEAQTEAKSTASELISGLSEKFQSSSEEDKGFDLSQITGLLGGNAGSILNTAKSLFGK